MPDHAPPELLPCPFCGGEAIPCTELPIGRMYVRCLECDSQARWERDREGAVAAWNRRVPHPDAARLDLIERHRLDVRELVGFWWCRDRRARDYPHGESAREAIDAAAKALEVKGGEIPPEEE